MISYGRQNINQSDIDAVVEVLKSDFLTQGPVVKIFEQTVANYCGSKYAVAVNSSTSGLHIACLALELGVGDWLWTSPNTFVASANCALYCGAKVDFVDIDPLTANMSIECLAEKLVQAEKTGKLPKVVMPVHLSGQSCDMESIFSLSQQYGFKIIEDASHAIGGKYKNQPVGNCRYSDITVFSFHPVKIITTGEGGMVVTNLPDIDNRLRLYRSHGVTSDASEMHLRPADEIWNYQQINLGFNYRMTDIQAALGVSQMRRLDDFVTKRHQISHRYNKLFASLPFQLPWQDLDSYSSYHLYQIRIKGIENKISQREVYDELQSKGINVNLHYIPVYRQPFYEKMGFKAGYCPESEKFHKETLSIPIYAGLKDADQKNVIDALTLIFS